MDPTRILRLRVNHLPKYATSAAIKKIVQNALNDTAVQLDDCKFKKAPDWTYAFITVPSVEIKDKLSHALTGYEHKKKQLECEDADTSQQERQVDFERKRARIEQTVDTRPDAERLADQVTPLHKLSYSEQLESKTQSTRAAMHNFCKQLTKLKGLEHEAKKQVAWAASKELPFEMKDIIASPVLEGYRNKTEFTVGFATSEPSKATSTVGFLLGNFKDGVTTVLEPTDCVHIPAVAKSIAFTFQQYVRTSVHPVYDRVNKAGVWRGLLVRNTTRDQVMVVVQFRSTDLSLQDIQQIRDDLRILFHNVTTLFIQEWNGDSNGITDTVPMECIHGPGTITETLLGYTFDISPNSFFQVNVPATELLYSKCGDWARDSIQNNDKTVLLDLCCGTGTIGITLSQHVTKVIGVEMVTSAIEDAKHNAATNGVHNVTYICAKVEDAMHEVLKQIDPEQKIVAILDPPRSGMHSSVIRAIRGCLAIQRLVYVACDAKQATQNFLDLCRPESNRYQGLPFRPFRSVAVDLFPHTPHVELVVEFRRSNEF